MNQGKIISTISFLLIFLWVYAAASKLINFDQSRTQMMEQVFPASFSEILTWAIPLTELGTAGLLVFPKTRTAGLNASLFLLIQFTVYILTVMLNIYGRIPCSCGGILEKMSWGQHLVFNLFFLFITLIALLQTSKERRLMGKGII